MKRLSIFLAGCLLVSLLTGNAHAQLAGNAHAQSASTNTQASKTNITLHATPLQPSSQFSGQYYFFAYPSDFYMGLQTVSDMEYLFMNLYGALVDTDSDKNGVEIAAGYNSPNLPHGLSSIILYAHFPD